MLMMCQLLSSQHDFRFEHSCKSVISQYSFLNDFDSHDKDFLNLAGILLGKNVPKESIDRLKTVEKPLKLLFDAINISKEASEISTDEIRLFSKNKQNTVSTKRRT